MQIGDLVTWKSDMLNNKVNLEIGIVIGYFNGKTSIQNNNCVWVKFTNGQHAHKERTLCATQQLTVYKGIKCK